MYSNYLNELAKFNVDTIHLGLAPITGLLKRLGNPHLAYPSILIGGTNGKGSIASLAHSVLVASGLRTGLYTSPHLIDVRERIRVSHELISPEEMSSCIEEVKSALRGDVTYFEFLTAVGFLYFKLKRVDLAVCEVGMGGRLDATNVIRPKVAVISNIGLDHMEYLGDTIEAIAGEKAGIIKEGGVCITGAKQASVRSLFARIAEERRAKIRFLDKDFKIRRHRDGSFSYSGKNSYKHLRLSLLGRHQLENAALALGALEELSLLGFKIKEEDIRQGFLAARWEGRLEIVNENPLIILDGAHNRSGVQILLRSLKEYFPERRKIFVFGVLNDKEYNVMTRRLARQADIFIITRPNSSRAVNPEDLLPVASQSCLRVEVEEAPSLAIKKAVLAAGGDDLICITGSLYLVGAAREILCP